MKKIAILIFILLAAVAYAGTGTLDKVNSVQQIAPNGKKDRTLTVNSSTVDMRGDAQWAVFSSVSTCKFRTMSTTTKAGLKRSVPQSTWLHRGVNAITPYINFSSCTNGQLQRQ